MVSLDINDFQIDDYSKPMNLLMLLEMAVHSSLHYASGPIIVPSFSRVAAHVLIYLTATPDMVIVCLDWIVCLLPQLPKLWIETIHRHRSICAGHQTKDILRLVYGAKGLEA